MTEYSFKSKGTELANKDYPLAVKIIVLAQMGIKVTKTCAWKRRRDLWTAWFNGEGRGHDTEFARKKFMQARAAAFEVLRQNRPSEEVCWQAKMDADRAIWEAEDSEMTEAEREQHRLEGGMMCAEAMERMFGADARAERMRKQIRAVK